MISKNQVKYLHSLRLGKNRQSEHAFLAEGIKLVDDLLDSHYTIRQIFGTSSWIAARKTMAIENGTSLQEVTEEELKKISNLITPNEVLAVAAIPDAPPPVIDEAGNLFLILDRIQDPGNLGTIIRTADWFGIRHIFCSDDTADLYNPKVVQSTMGSIFRVSVHYMELVMLLAGIQGKRTIYGSFADGKNIYSIEPKFPAAIVIGNESRGISREYYSLIHEQVGIPSFSKGAESLNASVAAGILCSEFCRKNIH